MRIYVTFPIRKAAAADFFCSLNEKVGRFFNRRGMEKTMAKRRDRGDNPHFMQYPLYFYISISHIFVVKPRIDMPKVVFVVQVSYNVTGVFTSLSGACENNGLPLRSVQRSLKAEDRYVTGIIILTRVVLGKIRGRGGKRGDFKKGPSDYFDAGG